MKVVRLDTSGLLKSKPSSKSKGEGEGEDTSAKALSLARRERHEARAARRKEKRAERKAARKAARKERDRERARRSKEKRKAKREVRRLKRAATGETAVPDDDDELSASNSDDSESESESDSSTSSSSSASSDPEDEGAPLAAATNGVKDEAGAERKVDPCCPVHGVPVSPVKEVVKMEDSVPAVVEETKSESLLAPPSGECTCIALGDDVDGDVADAEATTPAVQVIPMSVQVNREWERLFGFTQAELRALVMKDGLRAVYSLTRVDSQRQQHRTALEAILACSVDYRFYSIIVSKWQAEVSCLVHTRVQLDETTKGAAGVFKGYVNTWSPLPDPRPPPLALTGTAAGGQPASHAAHNHSHSHGQQSHAANGNGHGHGHGHASGAAAAAVSALAAAAAAGH